MKYSTKVEFGQENLRQHCGYCFRSNNRTVRLGFSKLLRKLVVKYVATYTKGTLGKFVVKYTFAYTKGTL